jgi:asparagine synthase (glutamine-hydrolysing)
VFRYVALVWDDADGEARESARTLHDRLAARSGGWQAVFERAGLHVFCSDIRPGSSEPYRLHGGAGVVLGKVFIAGDDERPSVSAPLELPAEESRRITTTGGRRLVEHYWGRYVAFLHDAESRTSHVLRDPAGGLPCLTLRLQGVDVFVSHMQEARDLAADRAFSVNWSYVAGILCFTRVLIRATGLNEVSQVLPGECVELRHGRLSREFYWNLLRIAEEPPIEDVAAAAKLLRGRTRDCVQAWASSYESIVHMLSGGLDSAIVFGCLKEAPVRPRITCLNFHSPGSNTDERAYAALAAAGSEVLERPRNTSVTLRSMLQVQTSCLPEDYFFYLDGGRTEADVAAERQATAVFSGYGGDQLFYQSRALFAAGDFIARHGLGRRLFTVALDAARVDRVSIWHVLRDGLSRTLLSRRWSPASEAGRYKTLIRAEVVRDISANRDLLHPWFHATGRAPNGKIFHAFQLLFPYDFYNPLGREADPESVTPLLSQPLLELLMRIPTWVLTAGGWDRALARRAFGPEVPRRILMRRTKGGQEEYAKSIFTRDIDFARDLLLDGRLVREGMLDAVRLAEVLSGKPTRTAAGNAEVYGCLSMEAWLRQWLHA